MAYRDICDVNFPDLSETIRLMHLSVDGDDRVRWMFVMSQTPWIKEVITKYFSKRRNEEELVSDGLLALYKFVCRNKRKDISVIAFRNYAIHYLRREMAGGIKYRETQMMKRNSEKYVSESSLNVDELGDSVELKMSDPCKSTVVDEVCEHDDRELMKKICEKILNCEDPVTPRMLRSLNKFLTEKEDNKSTSRSNFYVKRQRMRNRIMLICPELREVFRDNYHKGLNFSMDDK